MSHIQVFVYGTLKPGHTNYRRYCHPRLIQAQPARIQGQLYHLSVGYPGMAHADQWVEGYVLTLREDGKTLQELDALEDYHPNDPNSLYRRELREVFRPMGDSLGEVWVYYMAIATIQKMGGILVPSGNWQPHPYTATT